MQREQLLLELDEAGQIDCWHIEYIERTIVPEHYPLQCCGNQFNAMLFKPLIRRALVVSIKTLISLTFFQGLTKPLLTKCKPHIERTSATIIKITIIASGVINSMIAQQLDMSSVLSFSPAKCTVACLQNLGPASTGALIASS